MTGSLQLAIFGVLALLGSVAGAPAACDKSAGTSGKAVKPAGGSVKSSKSVATGTKPATSASSAVTEPAVPVGGGATSKGLSLSSTMVYDLDNVGIGAPSFTSKSGVKVDASVYIIDMEGHSKAQIEKYKAAGKTVICYFSAGTLEPGRDDAKDFTAACACGSGGSFDSSNHCSGGSGDSKMDDWDEYWLDIHSATCKTTVRATQAKRIKAAKAKGCDGMDPDNVDSYSNGSPHGNTKADQIEYLLWLSQTVHAEGMVISLKNSPDLIKGTSGKELVAAFDLSVIESCREYNECDDYAAFTTAGKPQIQIEYSSSIKKCPTDLKPGQNLAVYSGLTLGSQSITLNCPGPKA